jgi:cell division protein FtsB
MRVLIVLLAILLVLSQYRLWFGNDSAQQAIALHQRIEEQQAENRRLAERNAALAAEVADLKSGMAAIEERARAELGMIRDGETFHQVVAPPEDKDPED